MSQADLAFIAGPTPAPAPAEETKPTRKRAAKAPLTDAVTDLAQSLGVRPVDVDGVPTYKPDAFVRAVRLVHDKLVEVRDDLERQRLELDAREARLDARERAVEAREDRQAGLDALGGLIAFTPRPEPRKGLFARWRG